MNVVICNYWINVLKRTRLQTSRTLLPRCTYFKHVSLVLVKNDLVSFGCTSPHKRAKSFTSKLTLDNDVYRHSRSNVVSFSHLSRNSGDYSRTNLDQQLFPDYSSYVRCCSTDHHTKYSDINQNSWIALLPKHIQSYLILARVDRTIGYWLLFLPCSWSISLATEAGSLPNLKLLSLFFVGSLLMRSAGCVINDLWDVDLDKKVARTASRPLASGKISRLQSLVFLAGQLSISLGILLSLNNYSIVLGASSLLLVTTYPLMKRITFWPQLFLGATMNWGCLLGWSAVNGSLDLSICLPLYAAAINWTLFYDTIYSFQDVKYDEYAGIKSTGLLLGDYTKPYLSVFGASMVTNLLAVGVYSSQTWPFYLGLLGVSSHLTWQLSQVDLFHPKDCLSKFKSNKWLGVILMLSIIASTLMKPEKNKDHHSLLKNS